MTSECPTAGANALTNDHHGFAVQTRRLGQEHAMVNWSTGAIKIAFAHSTT
jgi:hypothetical protein